MKNLKRFTIRYYHFLFKAFKYLFILFISSLFKVDLHLAYKKANKLQQSQQTSTCNILI